MKLQDVTIEVVKHLLTVLRIDAICAQKQEAVRNQDFKSALYWREKEVEERKNLVSYERLTELVSELDATKQKGGANGK
jgi:hypothetical protein